MEGEKKGFPTDGQTNQEYTNQPPPYNQPQQYPQAGYPAQYPPAPGMAPNPQPQCYASGQPQQQSSNVVVVGGQQPGVIAVTKPYVSFTGAIVLSCFVFWCCGWICGLIAFIVALVGQNSASSGDDASAHQMLRASYGLSIAGVVTGVILIIVIIAISVSSNSAETRETATIEYRCYDKHYCSSTYYSISTDGCRVCCYGNYPGCFPCGILC